MTPPSHALRSRGASHAASASASPASESDDDHGVTTSRVAVLPRQMLPVPHKELDGTICIYNRRTEAYEFYRLGSAADFGDFVDLSSPSTGSPRPLGSRQVRQREPEETHAEYDGKEVDQRVKRRRVEALITTAEHRQPEHHPPPTVAPTHAGTQPAPDPHPETSENPLSPWSIPFTPLLPSYPDDLTLALPATPCEANAGMGDLLPTVSTPRSPQVGAFQLMTPLPFTGEEGDTSDVPLTQPALNQPALNQPALNQSALSPSALPQWPSPRIEGRVDGQTSGVNHAAIDLERAHKSIRLMSKPSLPACDTSPAGAAYSNRLHHDAQPLRSAGAEQDRKISGVECRADPDIDTTPLYIGTDKQTLTEIFIRPVDRPYAPLSGILATMAAFSVDDRASQARLTELLRSHGKKNEGGAPTPVQRGFEQLLWHSLRLETTDRYPRLINIWRHVVHTFHGSVALDVLIKAASCFQLQPKKSQAVPSAAGICSRRQAVVAGMLCGACLGQSRSGRDNDLRIVLNAIHRVNRSASAPDAIARAFFDPLHADLARLDPDVVLALCRTPDYLNDTLRNAWHGALQAAGPGRWERVLRVVKAGRTNFGASASPDASAAQSPRITVDNRE